MNYFIGTKMQAIGFDKIADKYEEELIENNIYELFYWN